MNNVDALILNGSPSAGKSTLADAISRELQKENIKHAVIDLDEFACVSGKCQCGQFAEMEKSGCCVAKLCGIRRAKSHHTGAYRRSRRSGGCEACHAIQKITTCNLTAPKGILKDRVTEREPNAYWKNRLRGLVDTYHERENDRHFGDFEVGTSKLSVEDTAKKIIGTLGWS